MANSYKYKGAAIASTSQTSILTAGTDETIIIKSIIVTNNTANTPTVSLDITDSSASATRTFDFIDVAAVTKKGFLLNGENIILDEADILKMTAETANYFDVYVSILEIT